MKYTHANSHMKLYATKDDQWFVVDVNRLRFEVITRYLEEDFVMCKSPGRTREWRKIKVAYHEEMRRCHGGPIMIGLHLRYKEKAAIPGDHPLIEKPILTGLAANLEGTARRVQQRQSNRKDEDLSPQSNIVPGPWASQIEKSKDA